MAPSPPQIREPTAPHLQGRLCRLLLLGANDQGSPNRTHRGECAACLHAGSAGGAALEHHRFFCSGAGAAMCSLPYDGCTGSNTSAECQPHSGSWIWTHKPAWARVLRVLSRFVVLCCGEHNLKSLLHFHWVCRAGEEAAPPQKATPQTARSQSETSTLSPSLSQPSAAPCRQARTHRHAPAAPTCTGCSNPHAAIADASLEGPNRLPAWQWNLPQPKSHICPNLTALHTYQACTQMHGCDARTGGAHKRVGGLTPGATYKRAVTGGCTVPENQENI